MEADLLNSSSVVIVKLPQSAEEFSSNWKSLLHKISNETSKQVSTPKQAAPDSSLSAKQLKNRRKNQKRKFKLSSLKYPTSSSSSANDADDAKTSVSVVTTEKKTKTVLKNDKDESVEITKCLSLDCEFVGVGDNGEDNHLARVSIVNLHGNCVYDKFVKPRERVSDYRTAISGVRAEDVARGIEFDIAQREVFDLLKDRLLIGHDLKHDLKALMLTHPRLKMRDSSHYRPFHILAHTTRPSLKKLADIVLGMKIQQGEHDSVVDARITMQLYKVHRKDWENYFSAKLSGRLQREKLAALKKE